MIAKMGLKTMKAAQAKDYGDIDEMIQQRAVALASGLQLRRRDAGAFHPLFVILGGETGLDTTNRLEQRSLPRQLISQLGSFFGQSLLGGFESQGLCFRQLKLLLDLQ